MITLQKDLVLETFLISLTAGLIFLAGCGENLVTVGDQEVGSENKSPDGFEVPETCGNGTLDVGELCEGSELNGATCSSLGFETGSLSCSDQCQIDTRGCSATFEVSGVSGAFTHGNTLTISGSGFGSKENAEAYIFETMENESFGDYWTSTPARVRSESRHRNSLFAGHHDFQGSGPDGSDGYFTAPNSTVAPAWFVQYWFQMDENFDIGQGTYATNDKHLANIKVFRFWNPGSYSENVSSSLVGWENRISYILSGAGGDEYGGYWGTQTGQRPLTWEKGVWHCLQIELKESSMGLPDGHIRVWLDGQLALDDETFETRRNEPQYKRPFIIGFYNSWKDGSSTDHDDFYIDDVYVDTTWARVEIGNAPVYQDATHREIQPPTSWSSGQIQFTANTGSLPSGSSAYLYVIDQAGNISPGYGPITVQ